MAGCVEHEPKGEAMSLARPDLESALAGLKDFQRRTVDVAFDRLWNEVDPSARFLVADEVGLGKTLVAKGVIARTVDHLWDTDDRIDIVYICSNTQIARQNVRRLRAGLPADVPHTDRLTMLPTALHAMNRQKVNVISFTPGTSFQLGSSGGRASERALLYVMLEHAWGRTVLQSRKWLKFFQCAAEEPRMRWEISEARQQEIDAGVVRQFAEAITQTPLPAEMAWTGRTLQDELLDCVDSFRWLREGGRVDDAISHKRYWLIGQLRQVLARLSVRQLQPDLVILDEFQRFSHLLTGTDDASVLVQTLLGPADGSAAGKGRTPRTLLLSATPFKMYTLPDEPEGDDHYQDFLRTVQALAGRERAQVVHEALSRMRTALLCGDIGAAQDARDVAQVELRRVMARTERLGVTGTRDGMLVSSPQVLRIIDEDVQDYLDQAAVARTLGSPEAMEYWRSAPHVFELMERYHIKRRIEDELRSGSGLLKGLLRTRFLPEDIDGFREIEPGNARIRWLTQDVLSRGAWRAAWLAPALPYYSPGGIYAEPAFQGFTKRLVFSAWNVAPKGIATTLSYEIERRLAQRSATMRNRGYFASRRGGLLSFAVKDGRLSGMPVLALLYPSVTLARVGDPLRIAADLNLPLPLNRDELHREVQSRINQLLRKLPAGTGEGAVDQRWYWAAPFLLDQIHGETTVEDLSFGGNVTGATADGFQQHLEMARTVTAADLGPRPTDLSLVLAQLAVSGPGVCSLRTLARLVSGTLELRAPDVRATASDWAWSLRSLFNSPEIIAVLDGESDETYWRSVLSHAFDGNLQAVLDEYAQVLMSAHSLHRENRSEQLARLGDAFRHGSGLVASPQAIDFFTDGMSVPDRRRIRAHFAIRYGRTKVADQQAMYREIHVREAFNSPFWPFVLATTSVGQEGLDFHHYCHAVVHWNLPSNPVDLEQREGRVHRYRGHAVRKNVAERHGHNVAVVGNGNPWPTLFTLAAQERGEQSEIFPDWVYPGAYAIERLVPVLPMSRGTQHYRRLIRSLGAYRLTLGQPRQEEFMAYLGDRTNLALDLSP